MEAPVTPTFGLTLCSGVEQVGIRFWICPENQDACNKTQAPNIRLWSFQNWVSLPSDQHCQQWTCSGKIHLLKIDVDGREEYEAVFAGVTPVLHKVEILQIEMLEEEIGRHGMIWIMDAFLSHDFVMLGPLGDNQIIDWGPMLASTSLASSTGCSNIEYVRNLLHILQ